MSAYVEYQVRCFQCGHVHDEPVEWLIAHREVQCPAAGCGALIPIAIGELSVLIRSSNGRDEVLDLSRWEKKKTTRAAADRTSGRDQNARSKTPRGRTH